MDTYTLLLKDTAGYARAWVCKRATDPYSVDIEVLVQHCWGAEPGGEMSMDGAEEYAAVVCKWDGCCHWDFKEA